MIKVTWLPTELTTLQASKGLNVRQPISSCAFNPRNTGNEAEHVTAKNVPARAAARNTDTAIE